MREDNGIKSGNVLDIFPIVNRRLYPQSHWDAYVRNYNNEFRLYHSSPVRGVTTMNRMRGCNRMVYRDLNSADEDVQSYHRCSVCDILLSSAAKSSPEIFWEEVKSAYEQVGATVFYEVADSFTSFGKFLEKILDNKPRNLDFNPQFFSYG